MALSLTKTLSNGATVNYHIIAQIILHPIESIFDFVVQSYVSQAFINADGGIMDNPTYSGISYSALGGGVTDPTQAQIYAYLLTLPEWSGATLS